MPINNPPEVIPSPNLLRAFLACDRLSDGWYDSYGVSEARSEALTAPSNRKAGYSSDSFDNPASETAITLFMLANTDGWKQLNAFTERPRIAGDNWNPKFFEGLATTQPAPFTRPSLWSSHAGQGKLFAGDEVDYARLVLLFEVEAGGQAFRRVSRTADSMPSSSTSPTSGSTSSRPSWAATSPWRRRSTRW